MIFLGIYAYLYLVYEPLRYKKSYFCVLSGGLKIVKGVFFKKTIFISSQSVKGTQLSQGILQRIFNTYTLKLYTVGGNISIINIDIYDAGFLKINFLRGFSYEI